MISYNEAIVIDTVVLIAFFLFLILKTKAEKALSADSAFSQKSKNPTSKIWSIPIALLALSSLELLCPGIESYVRFSIALIVGIAFYATNLSSRQAKISLLAVACILLLFPKIAMLIEYPGAKASADAWIHIKSILSYSHVGHFEGDPYYTVFPVVYAHILFLSLATGIDVYYGSTIYYLVINLLTALIVYKICEILATVEKWKTRKISFPMIGILAYSITSYPNVSILRELPQSTGLFSVCLALFILLKIQSRRDKRFVVLSVLAALLALSHPFAPILITCFFVIYWLLRRLCKDQTTLLSNSLSLLPLLLFILYYSALFSFNEVIAWSKDVFIHSISMLFGLTRLLTPGERFIDVSFEIKYPTTVERLLYGFNWALPASIGLSFLLVFCILMLKHNTQKVQNLGTFLNATAITSMMFSGFAFAFSFAEYAFSRYFGTYAALMGIPAFAYVIDNGLKKSRVVKLAVIAILFVATIATITEYNFLPNMRIDNYYVRERSVGSEITTVTELYAADFLAMKQSKLYPNIYTDSTYASTVSFFAVPYSSSLPIIDVLSEPRPHGYILVRETSIHNEVGNLTRACGSTFYSNGETIAVFVPTVG